MTRLCHLQPRAPAYSLHQPVLHRFPTGLSLCELPVKRKENKKGNAICTKKNLKHVTLLGYFPHLNKYLLCQHKCIHYNCTCLFCTHKKNSSGLLFSNIQEVSSVLYQILWQMLYVEWLPSVLNTPDFFFFSCILPSPGFPAWVRSSQGVSGFLSPQFWPDSCHLENTMPLLETS